MIVNLRSNNVDIVMEERKNTTDERVKALNIVGENAAVTIEESLNTTIFVNGQRTTIDNLLKAIEIGSGVLRGVYVCFSRKSLEKSKIGGSE